jgi:hypothetical protein
MQQENGGWLNLASYSINSGLAALRLHQFGDEPQWCTFIPINGASASWC